MTRRKQQAPRRAAAYVPEEDKETTAAKIHTASSKTVPTPAGQPPVTGPDGEGGPREDPGSLEQMKAVYSSFLPGSCWSSLNLGPPAAARSFDWHQSAMTKTLQQVSPNRRPPATDPDLLSTVQLCRQSAKLYGSIFSGASRFRCKGCSSAYETLVELTVHMNETGHYRDDNHAKNGAGAKGWSKPRKRSLMEMEGKEDAQKVLKCMYCGHSFESLQDLSVHMIKTKHYQKVPLKEPMTTIAAKMMGSSGQRLPMELNIFSSQCAVEKPHKEADCSEKIKHRLGHPNGTSYTWQFETRKSQVLKCMECGSSHNSLQDLTTHMMLTGHFININKGGLKRVETPLSPRKNSKDEKVQSVPLAPSSFSSPSSAETPLHPCSSPSRTKREDVCPKDNKQLLDADKRDYLSEEDLKESPRGGLDILKSLEDTVTSAIHKAQNGSPSWGGYPSIHAAYQLPSNMTQPPPATSNTVPTTCKSHHKERFSLNNSSVSPDKDAMLKQVMGKGVEGKKVRKPGEWDMTVSLACRNESSESDSSKAPKVCASTTRDPSVYEENEETNKLSTDPSKSHISALNINSVVTTNTLAPDHQPTVDPISALQTVMNLHLGGATKPALSVTNPMDMLFKMSNSMAKKVLLKAVPPETDKKMESANGGVNDLSKDQPIDLSKGQSKTPASSTRIPASQPTSMPCSSTVPKSPETLADAPFMPSSPYQENALADISDMLRNLTEPNVLSKVSKRGSWLKQSTSERASIADETEEEDFTSQKHKGHQSNWNPIHLLILQACFTASLRRTADGKYVSTDLSPKERTQISNLTGLSMATISHWLANVKYQLRRSGRTKFLRNLDVGQPVFFCSQCSSQVRSPSAHVYHLESHLGFRMKDFPKLSADKLRKSAMRINKALPRLHSLPADKKGTQPDHHQPACTQTPPQQGSWNKPRGVHIISV